MSQTRLELLNDLFNRWCGEKVISVNKLPVSGSPREYYRIAGPESVAIGAINLDREENVAFLDFSRHFKAKGLAVPEVYLEDLDHHAYLQEDLGNLTLFDYLVQVREDGKFPENLKQVYRDVLTELQRFQIIGAEGLNYNVCYPRSGFDRQSMQWDLSYFKYYFLKLAGISFNEQQLENDYNTLMDYLLAQDTGHVLYRDFQSRNIMLMDLQPYFIDYQGGRKGALQYDVASLLFEARIDLPSDLREELLQYYLEKLGEVNKNDAAEFEKYYYGFVLVRIMQAMGAYGLRAIIENIPLFLQSIPFAIQNIGWLIDQSLIPQGMLELTKCLKGLAGLSNWKHTKAEKNLTLNITSFSYKLGIPRDYSGHGGGYVFDCRTLPNPGRIEVYKKSTGRDQDVIDFMAGKPEVSNFLEKIFSLMDQSVEVYTQRGYTNLMVNFGCTGGQHRSVYCAEQLKAYLEKKHPVNVVLKHREQDKKET